MRGDFARTFRAAFTSRPFLAFADRDDPRIVIALSATLPIPRKKRDDCSHRKNRVRSIVRHIQGSPRLIHSIGIHLRARRSPDLSLLWHGKWIHVFPWSRKVAPLINMDSGDIVWRLRQLFRRKTHRIISRRTNNSFRHSEHLLCYICSRFSYPRLRPWGVYHFISYYFFFFISFLRDILFSRSG